jgi:hypothetical protein
MLPHLFIIWHHGDTEPSHNKFNFYYVKNSRVHIKLLYHKEEINVQQPRTHKKTVRVLLILYESLFFHNNILFPKSGITGPFYAGK